MGYYLFLFIAQFDLLFFPPDFTSVFKRSFAPRFFLSYKVLVMSLGYSYVGLIK